MGPGPVNAHPRVLRAMSADMLGQFDPEMTGYMEQVMALYRPIFGTDNRWTFLVNGTARAGIEAALVSLVQPRDRMLVIDFGPLRAGCCARSANGSAQTSRCCRCRGARPCRWTRSPPRSSASAPMWSPASTATPPPRWHSRSRGWAISARRPARSPYVDATATIGGMEIAATRWGVDIVTGGLQKCLGGPRAPRRSPSPIAPPSTSSRAAMSRRHRPR